MVDDIGMLVEVEDDGEWYRYDRTSVVRVGVVKSMYEVRYDLRPDGPEQLTGEKRARKLMCVCSGT